ncbi:hypothetical protein S245_044193, partial [Arachis hypogaea]
MSYIFVHCYNNFNLADPQAFTATRRYITTPFAAKSGEFSLNSGTEKNKKNGNIFKRW